MITTSQMSSERGKDQQLSDSAPPGFQPPTVLRPFDFMPTFETQTLALQAKKALEQQQQQQTTIEEPPQKKSRKEQSTPSKKRGSASPTDRGKQGKNGSSNYRNSSLALPTKNSGDERVFVSRENKSPSPPSPPSPPTVPAKKVANNHVTRGSSIRAARKVVMINDDGSDDSEFTRPSTKHAAQACKNVIDKSKVRSRVIGNPVNPTSSRNQPHGMDRRLISGYAPVKASGSAALAAKQMIDGKSGKSPSKNMDVASAKTLHSHKVVASQPVSQVKKAAHLAKSSSGMSGTPLKIHSSRSTPAAKDPVQGISKCSERSKRGPVRTAAENAMRKILVDLESGSDFDNSDHESKVVRSRFSSPDSKQKEVLKRHSGTKNVEIVVLDKASMPDDRNHKGVCRRPFREKEKDAETLFIYPKGARGAIKITMGDARRLKPFRYQGDSIINFYMKYFQAEEMELDLSNNVYFFSSFFYTRLTNLEFLPAEQRHEKIDYQGVRRWTANVDIFSKTHLVVPVCTSLHWSLYIIVNPDKVQTWTPRLEDSRWSNGQVGGNENASVIDVDGAQACTSSEAEHDRDRPLILVFDSLDTSASGHRYHLSRLREYLKKEYEERKSNVLLPPPPGSSNEVPRSAKHVNDIEWGAMFCSVSLRLPRQSNNFDCGLFLMYYVKMYFSNSRIRNGGSQRYPRLSSWFTDDDIARFREHLVQLVKRFWKEDQISQQSASLVRHCSPATVPKQVQDQGSDEEESNREANVVLRPSTIPYCEELQTQNHHRDGAMSDFDTEIEVKACAKVIIPIVSAVAFESKKAQSQYEPLDVDDANVKPSISSDNELDEIPSQSMPASHHSPFAARHRSDLLDPCVFPANSGNEGDFQDVDMYLSELAKDTQFRPHDPFLEDFSFDD